ncbi:MAG: beta-N-acetylglucosaminidase domain-containing protein, partial [Opitutales bacterium]|nr:beta-N-acetylglucosaminidase domain-containing protein [Opitutales bacterium]
AGVVGGITRRAAEAYGAVAGHKLFIWDNYPVNDNTPTMHLGPLVNRDPDLCRAAEGYMSNSMCSQNEANRLPMLTCAEYAYNPAAYDPEEAIGQALLLCAGSRARAECLRRLVEAYPGFLLYAPPSTSTNPVRDRFVKLVALPQGRSAAEAYADAMGKLLRDLRRLFPGRYRAEGRTLAADVAFMRGALAAEP